MKRKDSVNVDLFTTNFNEYSSYILGLIWADGYLNKSSTFISCEILQSSFDDISNILNETGGWLTYYRTRPNRKPIVAFMCFSKIMYDFLINCDFTNKSILSPTKILQLIPLKLHKYFFMGWIDGDGNFYHKNSTKQFGLSGSYQQDWSSFENLCNQLDIKYSIQRLERENKYKHSTIRITNKSSLIKLHNYLYLDNKFIGLKYKFNTSLSIIQA